MVNLKNKIKRVAAINDMSGIGRCSLTAVIPILSTLGIQCCPFPTAILSNQTEYSKFTFLDLTDNMKEYKNSWKGLDITFDCIYSGFLGSESQINIVSEFVKNNHDALIVIYLLWVIMVLFTILTPRKCVLDLKNLLKWLIW